MKKYPRGKSSSLFNALTTRIFTVFRHSLLEDRVLHKEAWVAKLLGTHLSIQVHKKIKFSRRDNSFLAVKELISLILLQVKVKIIINDSIKIN